MDEALPKKTGTHRHDFSSHEIVVSALSKVNRFWWRKFLMPKKGENFLC